MKDEGGGMNENQNTEFRTQHTELRKHAVPDLRRFVFCILYSWIHPSSLIPHMWGVYETLSVHTSAVCGAGFRFD